MTIALWRVCRAEFLRSFRLARRYPFHTVTSLTLFYLVASGLLLARPHSQSHLPTNLISIIMWLFAFITIATTCLEIEEDTKLGVIEQLHLCSIRFPIIMIARNLISMLFQSSFVILLFTILTFTHHVHFQTNGGAAVLILIVQTIGLFGIGLLLAGFTLVWKRSGAMVSLATAVVSLACLVPKEKLSGPLRCLHNAIPLTQAIEMFHRLERGGPPLLPADYILLITIALIWLTLGLVSFARADRIVRRRGTLDQY